MSVIFGHRGFSGKYPENTMLAFREAIALGVAGIETDVQLSRDGVPMMIHDERLERTTNGAGLVRDFTCAELQKLDARGKFGTDVPFQTLPTLEEYLDYMRGERFVTNIELKTGVYDYPGLVEKVVAMVERFGLTDRIWYSSFNHYSVLRAKELCPAAKCGLLTDCWIVDVGAYGKRLGMQTINGGVAFFSREGVIDEVHRAGLEAIVWTPNEPAQLRRQLELGADVLITNYPDRGLEALKALNA